MPHGELTARVALTLQQIAENQGFSVLHDHRRGDIDSPVNVGKLRIWFGETPKRETLLADLDIAIISADDEVIALIEIEETTDKPKVILGDILAILLGKGITDKTKKVFKVGKWTTLIVMSLDETRSHIKRTEFISEQINMLKPKLESQNRAIGQIIVENFADEKQLEKSLKQHVVKAIACYETEILSSSKN